MSLSPYYTVGNNIIILQCRWAAAEQVMSSRPEQKTNNKRNLPVAVRDAYANNSALLLYVSVA